MRYTRSPSEDHSIGGCWWPLGAAAILTAVLIGGCGGSSPLDPLAAKVVEARTEQMQQIGGALDEVVAALDGQVLGESSIDQCYEGQRNWKVDTGYHYRCSLLMGVLIGIDGDFRSQMLDVDVALGELGWQSSSGEWPGQLVDRYWDLRAGEGRGHVRLDRLPGPLSVMRGDLRLLFDYGSVADDRGLERIERGQQRTSWCCGLPFFENRELMEVHQATEAQRHEHLILIAIEGHYS